MGIDLEWLDLFFALATSEVQKKNPQTGETRVSPINWETHPEEMVAGMACLGFYNSKLLEMEKTTYQVVGLDIGERMPALCTPTGMPNNMSGVLGNLARTLLKNTDRTAALTIVLAIDVKNLVPVAKSQTQRVRQEQSQHHRLAEGDMSKLTTAHSGPILPELSSKLDTAKLHANRLVIGHIMAAVCAMRVDLMHAFRQIGHQGSITMFIEGAYLDYDLGPMNRPLDGYKRGEVRMISLSPSSTVTQTITDTPEHGEAERSIFLYSTMALLKQDNYRTGVMRVRDSDMFLLMLCFSEWVRDPQTKQIGPEGKRLFIGEPRNYNLGIDYKQTTFKDNVKLGRREFAIEGYALLRFLERYTFETHRLSWFDFPLLRLAFLVTLCGTDYTDHPPRLTTLVMFRVFAHGKNTPAGRILMTHGAIRITTKQIMVDQKRPRPWRDIMLTADWALDLMCAVYTEIFHEPIRRHENYKAFVNHFPPEVSVIGSSESAETTVTRSTPPHIWNDLLREDFDLDGSFLDKSAIKPGSRPVDVSLDTDTTDRSVIPHVYVTKGQGIELLQWLNTVTVMAWSQQPANSGKDTTHRDCFNRTVPPVDHLLATFARVTWTLQYYANPMPTVDFLFIKNGGALHPGSQVMISGCPHQRWGFSAQGLPVTDHALYRESSPKRQRT